jgi:hypothetical protein
MSEAQRQAALCRKEKGTQPKGWKRPLRTHCKNNHKLSSENIYLRKDGERACRICRTANTEAWWDAQTPERQEQRRKRNIARATLWNKTHPEEFKEAQRKQERRPEVKARRHVYYHKNRNSVRRRYSVLKSTAKKLGRDFTLSQEDYGVLVANNTCHYCGGCLPQAGCGLDRQDNRMGYVHGNVVPCCERCNEHKGSLEGVGFTYPRTVELLMELVKS